MPDVKVLLEVVFEREVDERSPVGGQLHRGRQAALDDRKVARREVAVEVVHVWPDVGSLGRRQRRGIDPRAGDRQIEASPVRSQGVPQMKRRSDRADGSRLIVRDRIPRPTGVRASTRWFAITDEDKIQARAAELARRTKRMTGRKRQPAKDA